MPSRGDPISAPEKTALYRHFDSAGTLLYVGISLRTVHRLAQHRHGSVWFDQIASVTIEHFPSREDAHAAERKAIRSESPKYNRVRYAEPSGLGPTADQQSADEPEIGGPELSEYERERIIDAVCCPPCSFDNVDGLAACLGLGVDDLRPHLAAPADGPAVPDYCDLIALADRLCRGTLKSEMPWVIGSPLPTRITTATDHIRNVRFVAPAPRYTRYGAEVRA